MSNLLIALANIIENPFTDLVSHYSGSNRINGMGDSLEVYIKDAFCHSFGVDKEQKYLRHSSIFSYLGNPKNPPDMILRNGDAIEVKKIEKLGSGIALNSSYPKHKLHANSLMLTNACKKCEDWHVKDILYVVGTAVAGKLKTLWFVYGDCYAADKEVYEKIRNKISKGVNELEDVEFSTSKELGRVNCVDPLGITHLRIRGMWGIENPSKVFDYLSPKELHSDFAVKAIMLNEKYVSFPQQDRKNLEKLICSKFSIKDIKIKSPNNPAKLLEAKLLSFQK